ncbi:MAG TPA: DsbC family protein [Steroidobacteraceae bacterium]|nr:DsbC family protein [Steroidobacteraceae bacterium]
MRAATLVSRLMMLAALSLAAVSGRAADVPNAAQSSASPGAKAPATQAPTINPSAINLDVAANADAAAASIPGIKKEDVRPTPVAGVFEVRRGADIVYMSTDGQYVFTGDLYNIPTHSNLTEAHRRVLRQKLIDAIPEAEMVIFSPPQPKYTVTVFTDVDCAYCRELHRQIAEYNRLGVRVRYIFYPRTGPNTESWHKAEQVWCSADRKSALTRAKLGQPLDAKPCGATPVARQYALGKAIGLEGTPGIVASNGAMVGGYLPPQALVEELAQQTTLQ